MHLLPACLLLHLCCHCDQILFGTCSTWFLLDVAYYAQNLFTPEVVKAMGYAPIVSAQDVSGNSWSIYNSVSGQAVGSMIVIVIGLDEWWCCCCC